MGMIVEHNVAIDVVNRNDHGTEYGKDLRGTLEFPWNVWCRLTWEVHNTMYGTLFRTVL